MKKRFITLAAVAVCLAATLITAVAGAVATAHAYNGVVRLGGQTRIETAARIADEGWGEEGSESAVICNGFSFADAMAGVPLAAKLDAPVLLTGNTLQDDAVFNELEKIKTKKIYLIGGEGVISADYAAKLTAKGYAVERISGKDRYSTAVAVAGYMAEMFGSKPESAFIVSGVNFPDALAVSPAAGVLGQPILYAAADGSVSEETLGFLADNGVKSVVIAGGTGAVPAAAEEHLAKAGVGTFDRVWGADRYQTALAVNLKYSSILTGKDTALASGADFPDALAGGALAAKKAMPVVLMNNISNVDGAYDFIQNRGTETVYVFGLKGALSDYAVNTFLGGGTITTAPTTTTTTASTTTTTKPTTTTTTAAANAKKITSAGGTVNVRKDAGLEFERIGSINTSSVCPVIDSKKDSDGNLWYKISYNGTSGYVMGSLVRFTDGSNNGNGGTSGKKVAYLTFDDGPSKNTAKILDILDRYNVKATFFVKYNSGYESTYKDIVKRGHTIALHSYTHDYAKIYRSTSAYYDDLYKLSDYVERVTGVESKILRFPGGSSNTISRSYCRGIMSTLTKSVQNKGFRYYDWNVDSGDADGTTVSESKIISNIKNRCGSQKQAVILMHDAASKTTTAAALPEIIEYLKSKGYDIQPITENTPVIHHGVNN